MFFLYSLQDGLEMALFVGRYVSCMIMFVLGMKAPGIMHRIEYLEEEEDTRRNVPPRVSFYYFYIYFKNPH